MNCFNWTNICTGATISTGFRVDQVDVTFSNCFNRTFIDAGSASGAIVVNNIGHDSVSFMIPLTGKSVKELGSGGKDTIFWNTQKILDFSFY